MPVFAASPSPRNERTYLIALGLVIVFAVAEILAALIHFSASMRQAHAVPTTAATPSPLPSGTPVRSGPATIAQPTASLETSPAVISASERLVQDARALKERGDTANALARLQEAAQRDPANPDVLAELASLYESIQLFDRANETWRKVEDMGPSAGKFYELATVKLKTASPTTSVASPSPTTDSAGRALDREGLPEGSVFGVTGITTEETPDPDAETNLRLKIAIKARLGVQIDDSKVRIMVLFYDLLDNEKVVPTDADVSYEWMNPKHDWVETNPETLIVSYLRAKSHSMNSEAALSAAAAAVTPGKNSPRSKKRSDAAPDGSGNDSDRRKYLGYVIRIFYKDKLQTVRAEPSRLLNDAPNLSP